MTTLLLSVTRGPSGFVRQTRLVSSGAFQLGRARPSDWVLDDPGRVVSKRHCVFRQDERGWSVADVSRNGCFLEHNNKVVRLGTEPHRVVPGEKLRIGDYEFAIDLQEDEASFVSLPLARPRFNRGPATMPPDVPARSYPRPPRARARKDDEGEPTRFMLHRPPVRPRDMASLPALLDGAALTTDDVPVVGQETDLFRTAGATLRAAVSGVRDLRFATLGQEATIESTDSPAEASALPVVGAPKERDALIAVLTRNQAPEMIGAALKEIQHHHDCLVQAARDSLRDMASNLDFDSPGRLPPHWLDVLPGWRRWRSVASARRRYEGMAGDLDRAVDQALGRAYWEARRARERR